MGVARYIARRYQRSRRRSRALSRVSVIAIGGIAVGVMVLDITLAVMNGFHDELRRSFVDTMPMITVACHAPAGFSDLARDLAVIDSTPEVIGASPMIRQEVIVTRKRLLGSPLSRGAIAWGVDPDRVDHVQPFSRQLQPGPQVLERLRQQADEVPYLVLGKELALNLYAGLGDTVLVTAPRGEIATGELKAETRPFLVAGFLSSGMYEFDSRFLYLDLVAARDMFGYDPRGAGLIGVRVADMMRAAAVADTLAARLGPAYRAVDWMALNSTIFRWVQLEKVLMFLLVGLIILVAAFNIIGILTMMVGERGREVGILLAMGASTGQVQRVFVLNGLWFGFWGTAAGSFAAWLACQYLVKFGIPIPGDVYFVDRLPCIPQTGDFLAVALAAMALTLVSTLVPSREASRLDPMEIIRYT
ncbi:MAG: ABC transporter permease [Candidatus Krumholzibacteria bacterium]|nr:ABC transporter permease [Candidatus Krumholzibacteria bacterium]